MLNTAKSNNTESFCISFMFLLHEFLLTKDIISGAISPLSFSLAT